MGDNWQRRLFHKIMAKREANERMEREDPAAFDAKMRAKLPTSKCCFCGEAFKGYGHNAHPVRDEGVACDACNGAIVLPQPRGSAIGDLRGARQLRSVARTNRRSSRARS